MAESFYGEARTEGGGLPKGWQKYKLQELASIRSGKRNSQDALQGGKYPLFDRSQTIKRSDKYLFDGDSIIVPGEGKEFIPRYYRGKFDLHQRCYALFDFEDTVESRYLYYYLMNHRDRFARNAVGSTVASLRLNHFQNFPIILPPLSEQRRIAEVLGSLDDKIELNRRMSETLEAMSQAVFKSWFVDFDPVIDNALVAGNEIPKALQARASRRVSGDRSLPPAIQRLFPSEFESSAQGPIPKGWKIKRADDVADIYIGKTPPRKEPQWFSRVHHESEVWVSIRDMASCGVFIGDSSEYLSHEAVRKFNVRMAPKNSVLVSFKLTVGRVAITQTELATNEAIAHFVSPKYGLSSEYLYCYLSAYQYASLASTSSIATAINSKIVKSIPFLVPPGSLARAFHEQVFPYFTKISGLTCQTQSLSGLRDVLLPRLLSGTVSLHESGV